GPLRYHPGWPHARRSLGRGRPHLPGLPPTRVTGGLPGPPTQPGLPDPGPSAAGSGVNFIRCSPGGSQSTAHPPWRGAAPDYSLLHRLTARSVDHRPGLPVQQIGDDGPGPFEEPPKEIGREHPAPTLPHPLWTAPLWHGPRRASKEGGGPLLGLTGALRGARSPAGGTARTGAWRRPWRR